MIEKLQNLLFDHSQRYVGRHRAPSATPVIQISIRRGRSVTPA